jgi:hypothetical protein
MGVIAGVASSIAIWSIVVGVTTSLAVGVSLVYSYTKPLA